jgi:hypothetical protein
MYMQQHEDGADTSASAPLQALGAVDSCNAVMDVGVVDVTSWVSGPGLHACTTQS